MSVLLIYGENEFEASEFYQEKLAEFVHENSEQSLSIFDGEAATPEQVAEVLGAQSLFSSGSEMVAIKRLGKNTPLKEKLPELIDGVGTGIELIIYEPRVDKRSKLFKALSKSNSTKEFRELSDSALIRWMSERVEKRGGTIENGAAQYLAKRIRGNQLRLSNEINKLLAYDMTISLETINLLIEESPDDNVFDLLNFVAQGNKQLALGKYNELRGAQVESHYILVMLCWQMSNLLSVKASGSRSDKEISSQLGMNPYSVGKTKVLVQNVPSKQLKIMSKKIIAIDIAVKTTSIDIDQALKQLIVEL